MTPKTSSGKRIRVKLTKEDWLEIYFALHTKVTLIATYGTEAEPGQDQAWIRNLRRTMAKIGPDGVRAALRGVAKAK